MGKTSAEVKEELKPRIAYLTEQGCQPGVAVVLVGMTRRADIRAKQGKNL